MKPLGALLVFSVCGLGFGQGGPKLGAAQAVDIRVQTVEWHPNGGALLYSRAETNGVGLGVYRLGDPEGTVALHLEKNDTWRADWFEGSNDALVTVYRKVHDSSGGGSAALVYLIDGNRKTATEVFSRMVGAGQMITLHADLSPSLVHAVLEVQEGDKRYHAVLPLNGGRIVTSPDIDQALNAGCIGPGWTLQGTAVYSKPVEASSSTELKVTNKDAESLELAKTEEDSRTLLVRAVYRDLTSLTFLLNKAAPAAGTPVWEVVPANGVLRPVMSPGPWKEAASRAPVLETESYNAWIDFNRNRSATNSVWLMTGPKETPVGQMVASKADWARIAPGEGAVAYTTDGALFVRRISAKDR